MSAENTAEEKRRRRWLGRNEEPEEEEGEPEKGVSARKGRATPSRRTIADEEKATEGNVVTRSFGSIIEYFDGVRSELAKVTWPTREETRRLSILVLVATLISAIVLGLISLAFTELFRIGLNSPTIFLVVFAVVGAVGFIIYQRNKGGSTSSY